MRLAALLLVACSTRSIPDAGVANPAPAAPDAPPAQRGAHGAAINLVAMTDDGTSVLTQDATGGARLWPRLDGSEEPIVVHLPRATSLALGRDGDGWLAAALDEGGGLALVRVAASGQVSGRASIAPDPEIESIAIGAPGVLAVRADQTIAIFAPGGEQVAVLPAPPATRIRGVVTRGAHALAVLEQDAGVRAQWIDGGAWGTELPAFESAPTDRVELSPDGALLLVQRDAQALLVDAKTGREITRHDAVTIGFTDNRRYALESFYSNDQGTLVATRHGLEQYRIEDVGSVSVAPHPSGAYIATWGNQRISLYDHGSERWTVAAPLVERVVWLGDDLIAEYEGGMGKIDAATGALMDRVCGWSFGLSALPGNDPVAGDSICDAL